MKLSKNSKKLMLFFTKNKHIHTKPQTKATKNILSELYKDIIEAYNYLLSLKQKGNYFNVSTKKIQSATQISRPQNFNSKSFPELVRKHIDELTMSELTYTFSLYDRIIKVHFVVEDDNVELKLDTYNNYIDAIIMWLYILNQYASKQCSTTLIVYLYFTSLEKNLPGSNIHILDEINVNTAFTTTCPKDSEIVVFRKEEWFKVFIHETFHNFALDFSDMNNAEAHRCILDIFKVKSDVNLYESYTEFWAEIMNALFCSFLTLKDKGDLDEFLSNSEFFINFEITYSFFQLTKTLNFMGLSYKDLYSRTEHSRILRENLYKEKTNVLAYYVIKTILINNYQGFLLWCKNNNFSLLQFKKTLANQKEFCKFIEKNYKTPSMIEGVQNAEGFLNDIQKNRRTKTATKNSNLNYTLMNLRMSICELG
jgi:hypothetical protein